MKRPSPRDRELALREEMKRVPAAEVKVGAASIRHYVVGITNREEAARRVLAAAAIERRR